MTLLLLIAQTVPPVPTDVEPALFKSIITVLGWVAAVVMGVIAFVRKPKTEIADQPLKVQGTVEFVARRDFDEHRGDTRRAIEQVRVEMDKRFTDLAAERRASLSDLHAHITATGKRLTDSFTEVKDSIEERLANGNDRMNKHGEEIAALKAMNRGGRK